MTECIAFNLGSKEKQPTPKHKKNQLATCQPAIKQLHVNVKSNIQC